MLFLASKPFSGKIFAILYISDKPCRAVFFALTALTSDERSKLRWHLLDEFIEIKKGQKSLSRARVPAAPVSAEVLLLEMMAQTGGVILGAECDFQEDVIFAKVESATFDEGLKPGEAIRVEAQAENLRSEGAWIKSAIFSEDGELRAQARFLLMNVGHLVPEKTGSITFHPAFMEHYKIRDKIVQS